jgi:hypothetical protein
MHVKLTISKRFASRTEKGGRNSGEKNIKYKRPYTKKKKKKKQPCSKLY